MSVRVTGNQPEIAGYEFTNLSSTLGLSYATYYALQGSGVRLVLSETGIAAMQADEGLNALVSELGDRFASIPDPQPDTLSESFEALGLEPASSDESLESTAYRTSDQPDGFVVKGYYGLGALLQMKYMAWSTGVLNRHVSGRKNLRLIAPEQYVTLMTPSGRGIIVMRSIPGIMLDQVREAAVNSHDKHRFAAVEHTIHDIQAEIGHALGHYGAALARDTRDGNNLVLAGQHSINPDLSGPVVAAMIDQPATNTPRAWERANSRLRDLDNHLRSTKP